MNTSSTCHCTAIRRAAQALTNLYDSALAPSGLKVTQFSLLRNIMRNEGVSISALASIVHLDRTTLGRNLHLLEREGLVALATGADSREHTVRLTEQGKAALATATPLWEQAQAKIDAALGKEQLDTLTTLLTQLATVAP